MRVEDRLRWSPDVEVVELDGDFLLYDDDGRLRLLVGSAAAVWPLLDGTSTVETIADTLVEVAGREDVREEVLTFLAGLVGEGLAVLSSGPSAPSYRPARDVGFVLDGDTTLLVDLQHGRRQALSPTGSRVWELVCLGETVEDVIRSLRAEFPDAPTELAGQVEEVLVELHAAGFLEQH